MKKIDENTRIQLYGVAPAPSRDYYGLLITNDTVCLNTWHVAHGPYVYPKIRKCYINEYPRDQSFHTELQVVFGVHIHNFLLSLAKEQPGLVFMPNKLMLKILRMLSYRDIFHLSQTSKIFWEICNTNAVWKIIFNKKHQFKPTKEEIILAEVNGWKNLLRSKIEHRICRSFQKYEYNRRPFDVNYTIDHEKSSKIDQSSITNELIKKIREEELIKKYGDESQKNYKKLTEESTRIRPVKKKTVSFPCSKSASKLLEKELFYTNLMCSKSSVSVKQKTGTNGQTITKYSKR